MRERLKNRIGSVGGLVNRMGQDPREFAEPDAPAAERSRQVSHREGPVDAPRVPALEEPSSAKGPSRSAPRHDVRFLLPPPRSARHALQVVILGFAVEGATELYQFLERGNLVQGPLAYYTTLATTLLGFYLMFLGFREWHAFHPKARPIRTAISPVRRYWFGLSLFAGGTAMTAALNLVLGSGDPGSAPFWLAWPVGGILVLAFGNFFFGLRRLARPWGTSGGAALGWVAFAWSLGVGAVAGLAVGERVVALLTEFVTNWVALVASFAPIVVAMSPLSVSYALLIWAYWPLSRVVGADAR